MKEPADLQRRVVEIENAIAAAATKDFNIRLELGADDELSSVEAGINFMLESLQEMFAENCRKQAELERSLAIITEQREALRALSTPVLDVWDDVLVMPIIGIIDIERCTDIRSSLLQAIATSRARCVILDLTGVESLAQAATDGLLKVVHSARLLGARCVLTGLSPAIAQTLVGFDASTAGLRTLRNLKAGLRDAMQHLRVGAKPAAATK